MIIEGLEPTLVKWKVQELGTEPEVTTVIDEGQAAAITHLLDPIRMEREVRAATQSTARLEALERKTRDQAERIKRLEAELRTKKQAGKRRAAKASS